VGFFDRPAVDEYEDDDEFEDDDDQIEFDDGRRTWIGGTVPLQLVVARSEDAVVVVTHITVFPSGFEFRLGAHLREWPKLRGPGGRRVDVFGPDRHGGELPDWVFRFGIEWPDEGRATNLDEGDWWCPEERPPHGLSQGSSSSGGRDLRASYWAWPTPLDGELALICEWPAFGIPETHLAVPASAFAAALENAERLWPDP
jgi:hypothetical protein